MGKEAAAKGAKNATGQFLTSLGRTGRKKGNSRGLSSL